MAQAIGYLANQQAAATQVDVERRTTTWERRYGIKREQVKIAAGGVLELIDEFDSFETEFLKSQPPCGRDWAMMVDESLIGRAKTWRDSEVLYPPGSTYYNNFIRPDCTDRENWTYYRWI